jgi:hypothetical protein
MQISGHILKGGGRVITTVRTVEEARALPAGSLVGDDHGGVTFSDAVACVLEQRSACGWTDIELPNADDRWTVIYLNR